MSPETSLSADSLARAVYPERCIVDGVPCPRIAQPIAKILKKAESAQISKTTAVQAAAQDALNISLECTRYNPELIPTKQLEDCGYAG